MSDLPPNCNPKLLLIINPILAKETQNSSTNKRLSWLYLVRYTTLPIFEKR